jgi:hypothetical protein
MYHIFVNRILTSENTLNVPDIPHNTQSEGGLLTPKNYGNISLPENAGKILTLKGYSGKRDVSVPKEEDVLKYASRTRDSELKPMSSGEIARAFGNFDVYFENKVQEYFPSHGKLPDKPLRQDYERVYEEKTYFDRASNSRETIRTSKPGPVEEECIVALRIASEPSFADTVVASKAIARANTLLYSGRTEADRMYQQQLPEMPTLLVEVESCLSRLHTQRGLRYKAYDVISQTQIPASEIPSLGRFMEKNGDLKHPLAYRLLTESTPDSAFYREQMERRERLLSHLGGDAQQMVEMYPQLKDLVKGLVCSVDLKNPPAGRVGVEIEFGLGTTNILDEPSRFNIYDDPTENREVSRDIDSTVLDENYLRDLGELAMYLKDGATHISSLHLHLDRDQHPYKPDIGALLGNETGSTVEESYDKNTWEVRGLLPPAHGNDLDPACIADIIQFYISASAESANPRGALRLPEGTDPKLEQIIFAHICRFVSSPEGRMAALKVLEHPLVLRAVDPRVLIANFAEEDQEITYQVLKSGLVGKYAKHSLKMIGRRYLFQGITSYERLTEAEIMAQYEGLVGVFTKTDVLHRLESGEMGIVGIDGNEYPIPTVEDVLSQIREKAEVLGPKMEQGFRKLLVVPFGMKIDDLANKYGQVLLEHHQNGTLFATKDEESECDSPLELDTSKPVWLSNIYGNADVSGELIYYPKEFSASSNGTTKGELLEAQGAGWKILLVEDLPNLPAQNFGKMVGSRLQLEANKTPTHYLELLNSDPMYENEIGMTPEDWLTYALLHLEETNQVIDDLDGDGKAAYLPGAYFNMDYVPLAFWARSDRGAYLYDAYLGYTYGYYGVRVAVSVT